MSLRGEAIDKAIKRAEMTSGLGCGGGVAIGISLARAISGEPEALGMVLIGVGLVVWAHSRIPRDVDAQVTAERMP